MALTSLAELAAKERNLETLPAGAGAGGLLGLLTELQGLTFTSVAGAGTATNIAVSGIATEDTLLAVIHFQTTTYTPSTILNLVAEATITSAGNIQLSSTNTTGGRLLVIWLNKR